MKSPLTRSLRKQTGMSKKAIPPACRQAGM